MAIKRKEQKHILVIILITVGLSICVVYRLPSYNKVGSLFPLKCSGEAPRTSETPLIDKVYTILSPSDSISFNNIYLERHFNYLFFVEVVSPHNCSLNVSLWDPENKRYDLFSAEMHYYPQSERSYEFPFGTVLSGNYSIVFSITAPKNLNIYIKLEQGAKCLYDIMSAQEVNHNVLYRVTRFSDELNIEHNIQCKSDMYYKFYIGRVSAISSLEDNEVRLDYDITDPKSITFEIFFNETMAVIGDVRKFSFGTAMEGIYTIFIKIYCEIPYINVAYSIIEDYEISNIIDGNETNTTNEPISGYFTLPSEWTIGFIIFAGTLIGILMILINLRRRKNTVYLNLKDRIS